MTDNPFQHIPITLLVFAQPMTYPFMNWGIMIPMYSIPCTMGNLDYVYDEYVRPLEAIGVKTLTQKVMRFADSPFTLPEVKTKEIQELLAAMVPATKTVIVEVSKAQDLPDTVPEQKVELDSNPSGLSFNVERYHDF